MDDNEFKMQREIRELKAEVKRLKRMLEAGFIVVGVVVILIFPELLILAAIGALGFFAFLLCPLGRKIFSPIFHERDHYSSKIDYN